MLDDCALMFCCFYYEITSGLNNVRMLVMDEADEVVSRGFCGQILELNEKLREDKRVQLFICTKAVYLRCYNTGHYFLFHSRR